MATLYEDAECIYLGDDERVPEKTIGQTVTVRITTEDVILDLGRPGARQLYPRSKLVSCKRAHIEWQQSVSDDLELKKSRPAVVCEFKAGPPSRADEPEIPDQVVLLLGFRNDQFAKAFEIRLKENKA